MTTDPQTDYDGCNSECRKAGAHTLHWGGCEHAVEPEPTVSMSVVYRDHDGQNSIGFDVYTVDQLAELLDPVLGTAAMRSRSGSVDLPHLAAHAIVHRNDDPAVSSAVARSAPALPAGSGLDPGRKAAAARRAALEAAIWDAGGGDLDQDDVDRFLARVLAELPAADRPAEEAYRLALSTALRLGTGANWEAIRDRAEDLVAEVGQLTETSRRLLEQRQEMAAERFAWQERGDQAEAAIGRVRAVLETEAVVGRSALEYRGLIASALMAVEAQQPRQSGLKVDDFARMLAGADVIAGRTQLPFDQLSAEGQERHRQAARTLLERAAEASDEAQQTETPACPDPIECGHEAALGQAQQEVKRLGLMVDEYGHGASTLSEKLQEARATNRRLNLRAQRLESELATYRKAVADWKISDTGAYVPLRTLAAIAKAAGVTVPGGWELHYERVERLEAAAPAVSSVGLAAHTTRAAEWRAAADEIEARQARIEREERDEHGGLDHETELQGDAVRGMATHLRRMADETQPAEAEAHPPTHTWKVESPRRDKWASWGATHDERVWAAASYDDVIEIAPQRPFRLVRATTTYAVEAEHQPGEESRP